MFDFMGKLLGNILKKKGGAEGNVTFTGFFSLLLLALFVLLFKSLLVFLAYNTVMPKLILSLSQDPKKTEADVLRNFRPITYGESIILVILFLSLLR